MNIFQFIKALKDVQKNIYIKLRSTIKQRTNIINKENVKMVH